LQEARVNHAAFEQLLRPCELDRCHATCCHDGVCLSGAEVSALRPLIDRHAAEFRSYGLVLGEAAFTRRPSGSGWKTATRPAERGEQANDYPAHFPSTRCVFLDREHRCAWQRLAMEQERPAWFYKPVTCWMHPVALRSGTSDDSRPVLTLASPADDPQRRAGYPGFASCTHCGRPDPAGLPARVVLEAELRLLSEIAGRDFVAELNSPSVDAAPTAA
jgi:Fe-S-cluster containining protein